MTRPQSLQPIRISHLKSAELIAVAPGHVLTAPIQFRNTCHRTVPRNYRIFVSSRWVQIIIIKSKCDESDATILFKLNNKSRLNWHSHHTSAQSEIWNLRRNLQLFFIDSISNFVGASHIFYKNLVAVLNSIVNFSSQHFLAIDLLHSRTHLRTLYRTYVTVDVMSLTN